MRNSNMLTARSRFLAISSAGFLLNQLMEKAQVRCDMVAGYSALIEVAYDNHPTDEELVKLMGKASLPRPIGDALIDTLKALHTVRLLKVFVPDESGLRFDDFAAKIIEQYPPLWEIEAMSRTSFERRMLGVDAFALVPLRVGQWIQPPPPQSPVM